MRVVGKVIGINRYPVKSMQGESLSDAEVGTLGIANDRSWAVRDIATDRVLSAKREGRLLLAAARTEAGNVRVTLPGGPTRAADDPDVSRELSEWLGRDVRLEPATPATEGFYEFQADGDGAATVVDLPVLDGSFFDFASLHLLTTSSLASASRFDTSVDWDVRRFRPTLLVEAVGGDEFPEDAWIDSPLDIGTMRCEVFMPTVRCAVPMRAQPALAPQPTLMPRLRQGHNSLLGVYASVLTPGAVAVGDEVRI